jgi:hypothetical protein
VRYPIFDIELKSYIPFSSYMYLICFGDQFLFAIFYNSLMLKFQVELDPSLVEAADGEDTLGKYIDH